MKQRYFYDCPLSEKLLYTGFLVLVGTGYLMALTYLYMSHEGHDGQSGLSVDDIVDTYYGNRSGTRLEAALRGPMSGFIQEKRDRNEIMAWLKRAAPEQEYTDTVRPILEKTCLTCHSAASGLDVPDFSTYDGIKAVANVDKGESLHTLVKLSHIHLFGIALVALGIGFVFRFAVLSDWLKSTLIVVPFAAILADIAAWFLTKWDPVYAYTVIIAGALLGLAWAGQILISLYQLWFLPPPKKTN